MSRTEPRGSRPARTRTIRCGSARSSARGFREDRRDRRWELDLARQPRARRGHGRGEPRAHGARERPDPHARGRCRPRPLREGLAAERRGRPGRPDDPADDRRDARRLHAVVPRARHPRGPFLDRARRRRHRRRLGPRYPPVRGVVGTEWTATARRVRGRGIARALKCETVVQAIALGVDRVRTGNDGANDPILHINESMGYRRWVDGISFLKDVAAAG